MSRLLLLFLNTITLIAVIIVNGLAGSGQIGNKSVGEVSRAYDTLITPSAYAFSIWGLIYLMLTAFVIYQWVTYFRKNNQWIIDKTGLYFTIANLVNIGWLFLWLNEYIGLSVIVMFILLASLLTLVFRLDLEKKDEPVRIIFFVWWPLAIYIGWIIIASVTNVAVFLVSIGWEGFPLTSQIWTIFMVLVAMGIYLFMIFSRNLRESAVVGIWALIAIAVKQYPVNTGIAVTAIVATVVLLVATLYHGYKNRTTAPLMKLKRGEF
ncbi:hypothetical protein JKA74_07585 [Marivirga sp. S37H4]|uniref:Tryptophan-rich sensory protein n=1 Tax=Marivirga aurantiaca TaxID=2802615 RepID=A0A935C7G2_9BACT|nr:hypothetical protein [Marivirga aurantiaca]MBK6264894.1 hypothetical protein [Marivirga aurantiaca]